MIEELARHRCTGSDGTPVFVIEHRPVFTTQGDKGTRRYPGAGRTVLLNGEPVRYLDPRTFVVIASGELLMHDPERCSCTPAARIAVTNGPAANP